MAKKAPAKSDQPPVAADATPPADITPLAPEAGATTPPRPAETPTDITPPKAAYKGRAAVIRELADRNRQKRDDDLRAEGAEVIDTRGERRPEDVTDEDEAARQRDEGDEPKGEQPPTGDEPPASATPPEGETTPAPVAKKKYVIDGQTVELTDEQITAYVQKGASADSRLAEATRILEGAKRTTAATPGSAAAPRSPSGTSSPDAGDAPSTPDAQELARKVMYGNQEEVTEAFSVLLGRGRQPGDAAMARHLTTQTQGMTQSQVHQFVQATIAFERARELLDKPAEQGGYADIWSDPVLQKEFMRREDELRDAGDKRPYTELYADIGKQLRTWRDGVVQAHTPKTGLENRAGLKRGTGVVRGAGGTPPPPPKESRPKTHEEKLEGMRAARGQH